MAEKRMFAKTIVFSDAFLDMPMSARNLYFSLNMVADDDGFVNQPKTVMRMVGASQDDLTILITRKFLIPFESGVVVIKHWRIHNYIKTDRYVETKYKNEKSCLYLDENKAYTLTNPTPVPECIQSGTEMEPQYRVRIELDKDSIDIPPLSPKGEKTKKPKPDKLKAVVDAYTADEEIRTLLYDWLDVRKSKRATGTETAIQKNLEKLEGFAKESGLSVNDYLGEVIRRTWTAFFVVPDFGKPAKGSKPTQQQTDYSQDKDFFSIGDD